MPVRDPYRRNAFLCRGSESALLIVARGLQGVDGATPVGSWIVCNGTLTNEASRLKKHHRVDNSEL
jgi:hypothetical protein